LTAQGIIFVQFLDTSVKGNAFLNHTLEDLRPIIVEDIIRVVEQRLLKAHSLIA
jgi:hypothetical protein